MRGAVEQGMLRSVLLKGVGPGYDGLCSGMFLQHGAAPEWRGRALGSQMVYDAHSLSWVGGGGSRHALVSLISLALVSVFELSVGFHALHAFPQDLELLEREITKLHMQELACAAYVAAAALVYTMFGLF